MYNNDDNSPQLKPGKLRRRRRRSRRFPSTAALLPSSGSGFRV